MTQPIIYCGTYKRVEDGELLHGPLVEYHGHHGHHGTEELHQALSTLLGIVAVLDQGHVYDAVVEPLRKIVGGGE